MVDLKIVGLYNFTWNEEAFYEPICEFVWKNLCVDYQRPECARKSLGF